MAVSLPNFWMALQDSMGSVCWLRVLTPSTKTVYKGTMTMKIQHLFDHDGTHPAMNVGSYVRRVGEDFGTGIIVSVGDSDVLDEKSQKVHHQRVYYVHWLDMNEGTVYSFHPESHLAPSSRSVPKFSSMEEAEAWMESQTSPGNWTGKAQDATDSASDFDIALMKILEEGTGETE